MSDRVGVAVTPATVAVSAGDTVQATITLSNSGSTMDQFTVSLTGLDTAWYTLPVSSVALFPNDHDDLKIILHPPKADVKGGSYTIQVKVTSQENAADTATASLTLQVGAIPEVSMEVTPPSQKGRNGHFHVVFNNPGAGDMNLDLSAATTDRRLKLSLSPPSLNLPGGGHAEASVETGLGWFSYFLGKRPAVFQISARAAGATEGKAASGQVVPVAWYEILGQIRLPWLSRPPVIQSYKFTTEDNHEFKITWAAKRAAEVKLDDEVQKTKGEKAVRPTEARTYVLTAANRYGSTSQKLELHPVTVPKAQSCDRIRVSLSTTQVQANAGGMPVPFSVKLENSGEVVDKFLVEVQGIDESWYNRSASSIGMMPRDNKLVQILFQPPKRKPVRAGTYPFAVVVRSQATPQDATIVVAELTVLPLVQFEVAVRPFRVIARGKGNFRVNLANTGVSEVSLALEASDLEEAVRFKFKNGNPVLPAWSSLDVPLVAKPIKGGRVGEKKRYEITVKARTTDGKSQEARAELSTNPAMSSWRPIWIIVRALIVLAVIFIVGYFILKLGGGLDNLLKSPQGWLNQLESTVGGWFSGK
jgi:uncharacterized membrane protein